jgi:hypothetical protein
MHPASVKIRFMTRVLFSAAALLAATGGCGGGPSADDTRLGVFDRIAILFTQYNNALSRQDGPLLELATSNLRDIVNRHYDVVVTGLASSDGFQRANAAFALGFSSNREAARPLAAATTDALPAVRHNAIASLGMLAFEDVPREPFVKALQDPEPSVRQAALFGLRPLVSEKAGTHPGDRELIALVLAKLSDPVMDVRNEALILLRKARRPESVPVILQHAVKDEDPLVRANAAVTLGAIGKAAVEANPYLIEMLRDDVSKVVESAQAALNRINEKDFDRSYGTWREWYEDEQKQHYVCLDHPDVPPRLVPGECPKCKKKLERMPREGVKKPAEAPPAGPFVCPDHPEVITTAPAKCGKPGCGKDLVPKKPDSQIFVCPAHPEILTTTPSKCGKPGCGRDLVPKK